MVPVQHAHPRLEITGKEFERTLSRQNGLPDLMIHFAVKEENLYCHKIRLSTDALQSQEELEDAIINRPAMMTMNSWTMRVSTDQPDHINWTNLASYLSNYSYTHKSAAVLSNPFMLKGDQAFGVEYVRREARDWDNSFWRDWHVPEEVAASGFSNLDCSFCEYDFSPQEDDYDNLVGLICRHLFHKSCLYGYLWDRVVVRKLPIVCPQCGRLSVL
ncbi:hypothetical protein YC2023_034931 [Brassica napus]